MGKDDNFSSDFQKLTSVRGGGGYQPLRWQERMFQEFSRNYVRETVDLPTGLGKTSIIHLWLLALNRQLTAKTEQRLPLRLVYVVDRRTVVDQATEIAERARNNRHLLGAPIISLAVSTLRGQHADNRDWAEDPSRPAIIIGTVDMIGSRLLFSGYRSSYKQRPLDAGMLGQDSLLILDEAHLSTPFAKVVRALSDKGNFQRGQGLPMRVMCMSATTPGDDPDRFKLEESDLAGDANTNPIIKRFGAKKRLTIQHVPKAALRKKIIEAALSLATNGARIAVFVRSPKEATDIETELVKKLKSGDVEVLTGEMRGWERDRLIEKPIFQERFLNGDETPADQADKNAVVLVCTSAGEVGFDLNADHMVCDATPLDSMIQRLGRVNRRGHGDATVQIFAEDEPKDTKKPYERAISTALPYLEQLARNGGDASPHAIDHLKRTLTATQLAAACTPKPRTAELTDILLDAWSMTTIVQPMPGRPPVAAWLRGLDAAEPETTIAWRAELNHEEFGRLDIEEVGDWFDAHRLLPHETLSLPTRRAAEHLLARWKNLSHESRDKLKNLPCVVDHAGLQLITIEHLIEQVRANTTIIALADLILPAAFGGIDTDKGWMDENAPRPPEDNQCAAPDLFKAPDVADETSRHRLLCSVHNGAVEVTALTGDIPADDTGFARFSLDLPSDGDASMQLISFVPKRQRPEFGTTRQFLSDHVRRVQDYARNIGSRLGLETSPEIAAATALASEWHDHGKDRKIWQDSAGRRPDEPALGKSGRSMKRTAAGYRHEFGSICQLIASADGRYADDVLDLALHMIATHHGRGRPHFPKGGFDPLARAQSAQAAVEVVRRFARLQRKYGYWRLAWLENLLRCADAAASAEGTEP